MTSNQGPSWNRLITVGSAFGIPLVGAAFAVIVLCVRMDDKMVNFQLKQQEQSSDIKDIRDDLNTLKVQVDTLTQRQKDNQRETQYRFMLQERLSK